jgi:hypothetical protein
MSTDYRALCAELVETLAQHQDRLEDAYHPDHPEADRLDRSFRLLERARAALEAQPEPEGPTDAEWDAMKERLWDQYETIGYQGERFMYDSDFSTAFDVARAVLARWGTPTAQPVPVSERPDPGPENCDKRGRCWWFTPTDGNPGPFRSADWSLYAGWRQQYTHWLPHWALPVPANTTKEENLDG